jgi:hypothetical protein
MSHSCLDCLHCKIIEVGSKLKCKEGEWIREVDGNERMIILNKKEKPFSDVEYRKVFSQANECMMFNDMNL